MHSQKEILEALSGSHETYQVSGVDILMAIYQRPEKSAGGVILSDNFRGEDLYQGKVGLILKVGPLVTDKNPELFKWFGGHIPKVSDWAVVRVGDTFAFDIISPTNKKVPCRLVEAKQLRGIVAKPESIW